MTASSGHRQFVVLLAAVLAAVSLLAQPAQVASQEPEPPPSGPEIFRPRGARVAAAMAPDPVPEGFYDRAVLGGLTNPTVLTFAPDGLVFVGEKSGRIKVFEGLSDGTPTVFADLSGQVHNFWDRGLLGLAVDPEWPARPYVYALHTHSVALDASMTAPGSEQGVFDDCPTPPGPLTDGCVASARLVRLTASGDPPTASASKLLLRDWCQQFPWHSIGTLLFGPDGALYAGAGESALYSVDYGQFGGSSGSATPRNPCGDPPSGVGGAQSPPTAQGGALRAQDLRTRSDPTGLAGAIIRLDPDTGLAAVGNPLSGDSEENAARIVAHGLRNPYRFTFRPGAAQPDLWVGDVGQDRWEEIDRLSDPAGQSVPANFGWPCYEGGLLASGQPASVRQPTTDSYDLNLCESLYASGAGAVQVPYFAYPHDGPVSSTDDCAATGASVAGLAFYAGGSYPDSYDGALFVADYSRRCMWVMPKGSNGLPDRTQIRTFIKEAAGPVDLKVGPGGDLYYVDFGDYGASNGAIRRISYSVADPTAVIEAAPLAGPPGTRVDFDGSGSTDPGGGALDYEWDLDSDSAFDDGTSATASYTYAMDGIHRARLRVTNPAGASGDDRVFVSIGSNGHTTTYLSDLIPAGTPVNGHGPIELDTSNGEGAAGDGRPLAIEGTTYEKGLGVHAASSVSYDVTGCSWFMADVGLDDETGPNGSVVFQVWLDEAAAPAYQSPIIRGTSAATPVAVPLAGGSSVRLVVTGGGDGNTYDHADWAGARALCPGNAPPTATIETPLPTTHWDVGQTIEFEGGATDPEDGALPASALQWSLVLEHCTSTDACHDHGLGSWSGISGGSFTAPDHEYPAHLTLRLTATDGDGASDTTSRRLDPRTAELVLASVPAGLVLSAGSQTDTTPFERTVIVGSTTSLSAPAAQSVGGTRHEFVSWSDAGARTHAVVADADEGTYTARYVRDAAIDTCAGASSDSPTATWLRDPIPAGDADWYRFRHAGGYARIVLGRLTAAASLELYGACGTPLARSDRGGTSFEEIYRSLPAGRYRVRISGGGQASAAAVRFSSLPDGLLVLSSARWISGGTLHIAGELLNNSVRRLADPGIRATFFDASGTRIGQRSAGGFTDVLAPRRRTSFHLRVPVPAGYGRASLASFGSPTTAGTVSGLSSAFTSITSLGGTRHYQGTIRNDGSSQVRDPAIFVTLYDGYGNVLNAAGAPGSPTLLGAGEAATFDVGFAERYESANRVARQVRATR